VVDLFNTYIYIFDNVVRHPLNAIVAKRLLHNMTNERSYSLLPRFPTGTQTRKAWLGMVARA
jgi:hypothetical protein